MNRNSLERNLTRAVLAAGCLAALLAFAEGFMQLFGSSLVGRHYSPSRLLEIGAVLAIFAIAFLLMQIRDRLPGGE